jgi:ribosomal-protein-alanine N-acetyltransferase
MKRLLAPLRRARAAQASPPLVQLRRPTPADADEFIALMRASRHLHVPWIYPPATPGAFAQYLDRLDADDHYGFLLCTREPGRGDVDTRAPIVGVVNINNVVRGAVQSGSLGYYAGAPYQGRGYMTQGLRQVVEHAFSTLGLHRLEANIQPANSRSKALVRRLGFVCEGVSARFLFIDGAWRDHERWALVDERGSLHR